MPINDSTPISEISKSKKETVEGSKEQISSTDEDVAKNIKIHTMPKRFKISTDVATSGKTKVIGAVIMTVGVLVLAVLIYFAYIYLINPKPEKKEIPEKNISEEKEEPKKEEEKEKEEPKKEEKKPVETPKKEEPVVEEKIEKEATTTKEEIKEEIVYLDTDNDGLSDAEEQIFGTKSAEADSDGDGYDDESEINNLYNPAGEGKLEDNPAISKFENSQFKYSVLHPVSFMKNVVIDGSSVIFGAKDNSFIQIISQANDKNDEIADWFDSQFPENKTVEEDIVKKDDWQGVFHKDKKIFYLTDNSKKYIFIISYVPEPENNMSYYNIFKMMINSFTIK